MAADNGSDKKRISLLEKLWIEDRDRWRQSEERWRQSEERWRQSEERWQKNDERWQKNEERWQKNDERWQKNDERWQKLFGYLKQKQKEIGRQGQRIDAALKMLHRRAEGV